MEECEHILPEDGEPNPDQLEETRRIIRENPDLLHIAPRPGGYSNKSQRQTDMNVSHDVSSWLVDESSGVDIATGTNPNSSRMVRIFEALDHWPQDLTGKERKNKSDYQHTLLCLAISTVISLAAGPSPQSASAAPRPPNYEVRVPTDESAAGNNVIADTEDLTVIEEFLPNADNLATRRTYTGYEGEAFHPQQQSSMVTPQASQLTYDYLRLIKDEENHIPLNILGILKILTIAEDPDKTCFCST